MAGLSQSAEELNWLVTDLVERIPGGDAAVVVSTDGFARRAATVLTPQVYRELTHKIGPLS
jgi:predicted regulator of Ras-like GTPase activity (Roadblock/LC7/MglB family)